MGDLVPSLYGSFMRCEGHTGMEVQKWEQLEVGSTPNEIPVDVRYKDDPDCPNVISTLFTGALGSDVL